jgi:type II secretory pathway component PulF
VRAEVRAETRAETINQLAKLIRDGHDVDTALKMLEEEV